jgi:hypothetical protein
VRVFLSACAPANHAPPAPPRHTPSPAAVRACLALAALAATLAAKLAFPTLSARLLAARPGASPALCDPAVGCTPAQLAAKRAPRPLAAYAHHSLQAAWGKKPAEVELVDIVDAVLPAGARGAVVNLGARDGKTHDPTYPLFARGHPGAAFEGWDPVFPLLDANLGPFAETGVAIVHEYARPDTFAAKLAGAGVTPGNLDVLKIGARGGGGGGCMEGDGGRKGVARARTCLGLDAAPPCPCSPALTTAPLSLSLCPLFAFKKKNIRHRRL